MEPKEGCCRRAVSFLKCSFEIEMYAIFVVSLTLRCGTVWINNCQPAFIQAPWGGVKQSGFGRELDAGACRNSHYQVGQRSQGEVLQVGDGTGSNCTVMNRLKNDHN